MAKKPIKLTRALAIRYKCHDCLAQYEDGKVDCKNPGCPLYLFMPYKKKKPDLSMLEFNPKKKGLVNWEGEVIDVEFEAHDTDDFDFLD